MHIILVDIGHLESDAASVETDTIRIVKEGATELTKSLFWISTLVQCRQSGLSKHCTEQNMGASALIIFHFVAPVVLNTSLAHLLTLSFFSIQ